MEQANFETDNLVGFGAIQHALQNPNPEVVDLMYQILTRLRDPNWNVSLRFVYSERNRLAEYLALLGCELFYRLYIFFEPIGRITKIMDLDLGLGPNNPQFLEAPMVEEEEEIFTEIFEDGAGGLAEAFMMNVVINGPLIWRSFTGLMLFMRMSLKRMTCLINSRLCHFSL